MRLWPFAIVFLPGRQRATPDQLSFLALGTLALAAPFFLRPGADLLGTHTQLLLLPCLFFRLTTVPCPTCGMTTSFTLIAHGQFGRALVAHPLGVLAYLHVACLTLAMAWATLTRRAVEVAMRASLPQMAVAFGIAWALKLGVWFFIPH